MNKVRDAQEKEKRKKKRKIDTVSDLVGGSLPSEGVRCCVVGIIFVPEQKKATSIIDNNDNNKIKK